MSTETMNLPGNANTNTPLSEDVGGTGISNPLGSTLSLPDANPIIIHTSGSTDLTFPTSGDVITSGVSGQVTNTVTVASATPGTVRSITGEISNTATPMTSGNLVGVRGAVTVPTGKTATAGFLYGVQGKVIINGTISGSVWCPAVFGQLDISTGTLSAGGQIACLWGDAGTTGPAATVDDFNMVRLTNTTPTTANSVISSYGKASYMLDIQLNGGTQFLNAGTSAGSAGDTSKCNATKVLAIQVDGVDYWIPVFAQNS